jgi:hypothetical protein
MVLVRRVPTASMQSPKAKKIDMPNKPADTPACRVTPSELGAVVLTVSVTGTPVPEEDKVTVFGLKLQVLSGGR